MNGRRTHPLAQQCKATSKRSGQRCRRIVIAAPVCATHGGSAPQVRALREARLAAWEAAQTQAPVVERDPAEQLLAASREADQMVQRLRAQLDEAGTLDAANLDAFGAWLDRVGRLARSVVDARIDERQLALAQRRVRLAEAQGDLVAAAIERILDALGLSPTQQQLVPVVVPRELRAITGGDSG